MKIDEPTMLIRIPQLYRPGMSREALYEATRGHWKVGPRRERAQLAMAVAGGTVREVYEIDAWHPAGTTPEAARVHREAPQNGGSSPGAWLMSPSAAGTSAAP